MSDNTILNPGFQGDTVRTLDRTGTGSPKTEVVQLDVGGPSGNTEFLLAKGAAPGANSLPVVLANEQIDLLSQLLNISVQMLAELRAIRLMHAAAYGNGINVDPLNNTLFDVMMN